MDFPDPEKSDRKRRKTCQSQSCEAIKTITQRPSCEKEQIQDAVDCEDVEHMLLYTSIQYDVFEVLVGLLGRFELNYFNGWSPSLNIENQLLIVLMKLKLNLRDIDLAHRFCVSRSTISNMFNTLVHALHEMLYVGVVDTCFPSQLKCKGSMPNACSSCVIPQATALMDSKLYEAMRRFLREMVILQLKTSITSHL
uniref:Transposase Helix-turn-helix domain-containing protein n=1 Tax=Magallana gigas TaxID=29159 RepID=A0A8W8IPW0_MAGGI